MKDKMREAIVGFPKQFGYEPEVKNSIGAGHHFKKFALVGMGGSGLVGELVRLIKPQLDIVVRKGYGLPGVKDLKERLLICVSYSGNTKETLDAFDQALETGLNIAVISTGGELLERAKSVGILYVELPKGDIQPRVSLGLQLRALLRLIGEDDLLNETSSLKDALSAEQIEGYGEELAQELKGRVPIIYSSRENLPLAYVWKIKFNETGKIPAFYNVFSELNHNEMQGFEVNENNKSLSENTAFIFLTDKSDDDRTKERMEITAELLKEKGFPIHQVNIDGQSPLVKVFTNILLSDWVAYHTAINYGSNPNEVPLIEEFKKKIK